MNYAGKFDGAISDDGPGNHSHFVHLNPGHVHAPADAIVVPDAHFLFNADFKRSGLDLVLSRGDDELVLHQYFKGEKHKALASPDGAHLTGELVDALTGHVEVAQAGGAAAATAVIGHITKLQGSATVIRNGVSIILNMGDNVEKGDVVQSGSNSTVGLTFIDGTVFGLSSNAKMVLNEMVYDPNGSNNSSLLSLVSGTITFVAGETAKHGDMKIDTPVATMGIRGTAVLVEIDFSVPGANGQPNASFQVLVEPDGTTGSYILFDKNTLQPLAIVNQAGQQININNGVISQTNNPLTPEMKALISDVFQKFFSNTDPNTKTASSIGSSTSDGTTATAKVVDNSTTPTNQPGTEGPKEKAPPNNGPQGGSGPTHLSGTLTLQLAPPSIGMKEIAHDINDPQLDAAGGVFQFTDVNSGDRPHVTADFGSVTYANANGSFSFTINAGQATPTAGLSQLQFADIMATAVDLHLFAAADNANNGKVSWVYEVADKNFDFLADGETLTFTYHVTVAAVYNGTTEQVEQDLIIVVTGTNDRPVITTNNQLIHFAAGTGTSGGSLIAQNGDATGGTFDFTDVDLTDTHWIVDPNGNPNAQIHKAVLTSASMGTLDLTALQALAPFPMSVFAQALDVDVSTDSTGTGHGTITWQLQNLPVFLADFIPFGETLRLFYTVDVADEHGSTDTKIVEVDITGTNAAATVWIHTTTDGHDGNWTTAANWGTGKTPTSINDVIIVTDQLHPNTPAYPALITTGTQAAAQSVVMNDFVVDKTQPVAQTIPPELKLEANASLTIGADFDLSADSSLTNAGTVIVGGKLELLDDATNPVTHINQGVIVNSSSGTIEIGQGGDIQGHASVTNSGTIELKGGTLNVEVNIANSDGAQGGTIVLDTNTTLVLDKDPNTAPNLFGGVTGGTVTNNGTIHAISDSAIDNAAVNGGQITVDAGKTLHLNNTTVTGAKLTNNGTIETDLNVALHVGETLKLSGVTLTGGTIDNFGTLEISGDSSINDDKLINTQLTIDSGKTLTLNNDSIFGAVFMVGPPLSVTGTISNLGTIDIAGDSSITDEILTNHQLTVESGRTLTLSDVAISGGTISNAGTVAIVGDSGIGSGTLTNTGKVNVSGTGNVLDNVTVSNTGTASGIDISGTLTAQTATTIANQDTASGETIESGGTLTLMDTSSISAGQVTNKGTLVLSGTTASLSGGKLTNTGQVNVTGSNNGLTGEQVLNTGAASAIDVTGTLTAQTATTIANQDTTSGETIESGGKLTLADTSSISGGQVTNKVGGTINLQGSSTVSDVELGNAGTLNLSGTAALNTNGSLLNTGTVNVSGTGNTLDHETVVNDGGADAIDITGKLTLSTGTTVTNTSNSGVTVESGGKLTVADTSSISGGQVSNEGTLVLSGSTASLSGGKLTNTGQANVSGSNNALTGEQVLNTGTASAIDVTGTLTAQTGTTIVNQDMTSGVTVEAGGTLTLLDTSSIAGGQLVNLGTVDIESSTGATLDNVKVTGGGTINVDANGPNPPAKLIVTDGTSIADGTINIGSVGTLQLSAGVETLTNVTVKVTSGGVLQVDGTATLDLSGTNVTGSSQLNNAGTLKNILGNDTISGIVDNTGGTIEVQSGSLDLSGTLTGAGTLKIDAGATLEIGSSDTAQTVTFEGGTGTLQLDTGFTGTITGQSSVAGNFTVTGAGNITTTSGDALDFNSSGGTSGTPAVVTITPSGTLTGAVNGIKIVQTGTGDVTVSPSGNVTGQAGDGIIAEVGSAGSGKISVNAGGNVTGTGTNSAAIRAENLNSADQGGVTVNVLGTAEITDTAGAGINAENTGSGAVTVKMSSGSQVSGGTVGINATASGGLLTIDNKGVVSGSTGVFASTTGNNDIAITNDGGITGTGNVGINIAQNAVSATGSISITNTGTVTGVGSNAAILLDGNGTGTVTITNTGTVGVAGAAVQAIHETTGNLTINNDTLSVDDGHGGQIVTHGVIDGSIDGAATTFINEAGAIWNAVGSSQFGASSSIDNTGTINLASATISGTGLTITNETGGVIDGTGTISGATITNFGTIEATGGTLTIDPAVPLTLTNGGALEAVSHGTLSLSNILVLNSATDAQSVVHDGTVSTDGTSEVDLSFSSIFGGTVDNANKLISTGGTGSNGNFVSAAIANDGTIEVKSGWLTLSGSISGTGSQTIDGGATLKLMTSHGQPGTVDGQDLTFAGAGAELIVSSASSYTGHIHGLAATDKIDLQGITYASASATYSGGVLTVTDGNGDTIALKVGTDFSGLHSAGSNDGFGGTLITLSDSDDAPAFTQTSVSGSIAEAADTTDDLATHDTAGGTLSFTDIDLTDRPQVSLGTPNVYDAQGNDISASLTPDQLSALQNAFGISPHAGVTNANNGEVDWTYSIPDGKLDFLSEGQVVVVKTTVTVTDDFNQHGTAEISVTITGANDAPTVSYSGASVVSDNEDTPTTISGLSAADPDGGASTEEITLSVSHGTIGFDGKTGSSITVDDTVANINTALANGVGYTPASNYSGTDDLHLSINDKDPAAPLSTTKDVAIGVSPVADVPAVATSGASFSADANSTITLTGFTLLSDTDGSETLSLDLSSFPAGATFSAGHLDQAGGHWLISASDIGGLQGADLTMTPPMNFGGTFSLHVDATVVDKATLQSGPATNQRTFSNAFNVAVDKLTANNDSISNAAPPSGSGWVFDAADGHYYRYVSASVDFSDAQTAAANDGAYLATITDSAENNFVAQLLANGQVGWTSAVTHTAHGTYPNADPNEAFTWTGGPEAGNAISYANWNSGEPNGGFGSADAAMQIGSGGGWNDVPTTPGWTAGYVEEWGGLSGQIAFKENSGTAFAASVLLANDTDSLGHPITVTSVGDANHHSTHGTVTLTGNVITYTPDANFSGQDSFAYTISEGGQTSTATVTFNVASTTPPAAPTIHFQELTGVNNPLNGVHVTNYANPALVDVNGDGKLDVVVGYDDGSLHYYKNTGTATAPVFVEQTGANNPFNGINVGLHADPTFVDLDGDGLQDMVVGEFGAHLLYFHNVGTGTAPSFVQVTGSANPFNGIQIDGSGGRYSAPTFADLDGGGAIDMVVGANDGSLHYFKNAGTASAPAFVEQTGSNNPFNGVNVGPYSNPAFVDVNGDGKMDLVVGSSDGTLHYLENNGTATAPVFVEQTGANNPFNGINLGSFTGPTFADLDGDRIPDAFVGTSDGKLHYLHEVDATASVADGGNWYATGQLTAPNSGNSPLTWSIVGGNNYAASNYQFGIHEFKVVKAGNTTIFDDTFNGTVPPAGPAIQNASSPSGTSYSDFGSGTYVPGAGEAFFEGSHAGWVGTALGVNNYGAPVFGQFTTLLTGTSFNTSDPTDGLRSGQSFTVSGQFDLVTQDNNTRFGIRLSDRVSAAADPADNQPGTETIDLGVTQNAGGKPVVVLGEYNFETGVTDTLQSITLNNVIPVGEKIVLSLSNDAANNGVIVASYQLVKSDGTLDGGPVTLSAVGHIFDNETWARPQFYTVSTATAPSSSAQADSVLQGTYGQLDLAQDGTWHYVLNPGLPSVKALAAGATAQDIFAVHVQDSTGAVTSQTISVTVTGINDAPVATAPAQYTVTSGTPLSLVNTGLSVSDPDDGGKTETVTLAVDQGTISIGSGNSGVAVINGSGNSVTFSGTIAQINALLNHSTGATGGTITYTDNASPGFFNAATLKLIINDNGSNGGNALADTAVATINVAPLIGTLDWNREIDPFATATTATANKWVIPNSDGLTSTVFISGNGVNTGNLTYDARTGLPAGGGISSIQLVDNPTGDNSTGHVMQTITNLNGLQIGDFGSFIAREQFIQAKVPWAGLIKIGENGPVSFTATDIRIANADGTFTELIGNNFAQVGDSQLTGTVNAVELLDSSGNNVLQTVSFDGGTSLGDLASAIFPDNASRQFYGLMVPAGATVIGFKSSVASGAVNYFEIDDTPGNHTYGSPSTGIIGVNFAEATSGVTVDLASHTASWGGFTDTLNNISFVSGSKFADTIAGSAGSNFLDGRGAATGHDTLTGGGAGTNFVFNQGYGALTITNFDQEGGSSFNPNQHDILDFNGFSAAPNVHPDGNGNTIADFGNGDVVTLLGVADSSLIPQSDIYFNGSNNGGSGNNGGGNNGGPVISGAGNSASYTGTPLVVDQSVAVADSTGTVTNVNVWISSGYQTGDTLSINGLADGTLTYGDGTIHFHFDPNANNNNNGIPAGGIFLSAASGNPSSADFDTALHLIQFTPGTANGDRTVTWAAEDSNNQFSPTAITTIHDNPILNITDGGAQTISGPSNDTVVFATGSGTLHLDQPSSFTGVFAGISGNGDVLDMHGFTPGSTAATTGNGSFDSTTGTTTLTVHDSNGNVIEAFKLVGDYSASNWFVSDDGHGGVNIVDPPASDDQSIGPMIMNDPGQSAGQITIGHGEALELDANSVASVTFADATGRLILDDASNSRIVISGFTGDGTLAGSDQIDLKGIDYNSPAFAENYDATEGLLTVTDDNKTANLQFNGTYQNANFEFISDGHGGTIVYDPPVARALADGKPAPLGGECFAFDLPNASPVSQHTSGELRDALAPLEDLLHAALQPASASPFGLDHASTPTGPQPSGIGAAAWIDSLKLMAPHTDLHV